MLFYAMHSLNFPLIDKMILKKKIPWHKSVFDFYCHLALLLYIGSVIFILRLYSLLNLCTMYHLIYYQTGFVIFLVLLLLIFVILQNSRVDYNLYIYTSILLIITYTGGEIVSLHSKEEADILQPFIKYTKRWGIFIGLIRLFSNNGKKIF